MFFGEVLCQGRLPTTSPYGSLFHFKLSCAKASPAVPFNSFFLSSLSLSLLSLRMTDHDGKSDEDHSDGEEEGDDMFTRLLPDGYALFYALTAELR